MRILGYNPIHSGYMWHDGKNTLRMWNEVARHVAGVGVKLRADNAGCRLQFLLLHAGVKLLEGCAHSFCFVRLLVERVAP